MNKKIIALLVSLFMTVSPVSIVSAQSEGAAAGGITAGTAVAIGIVGAALLVALGDSSNSAAAGVAAVAVTPAATTPAATTPAATTTTTTTTTTDTDTATTTTTATSTTTTG